jgi:hypothetical protein
MEAVNRMANKGVEARRKKEMKNGDVVDHVAMNDVRPWHSSLHGASPNL